MAEHAGAKSLWARTASAHVALPLRRRQGHALALGVEIGDASSPCGVGRVGPAGALGALMPADRRHVSREGLVLGHVALDSVPELLGEVPRQVRLVKAEADEEGLPLPANPWLSIWGRRMQRQDTAKEEGAGGGWDHLGLVVGRKVAEVLLRDHRVPLPKTPSKNRQISPANRRKSSRISVKKSHLGLQGLELSLRASCASKTVRTSLRVRSQHWRDVLAADHGAACELALGDLCARRRVNLELCKHTCTVSRIRTFCNPLASPCTLAV